MTVKKLHSGQNIKFFSIEEDGLSYEITASPSEQSSQQLAQFSDQSDSRRNHSPEGRGYDFSETITEIAETHISVVYLTENFVLKFKKPVQYPFIDQKSLYNRKLNCFREVNLNSRISPDIYLGVGRYQSTDTDYFVLMKRLSNRDRLSELLHCNPDRKDAKKGKASTTDSNIGPDLNHIIRRTALVLADFHAGIYQNEKSQSIDKEKHRIEEMKAGNKNEDLDFFHKLEENLASSAIIDAIDPDLKGKIRRLMESYRPVILFRQKFRYVDGHGDLRPDHVYWDGSIRIIDCVEFNNAFRLVDPVDDIAFLSLGLRMENRADLAELLLKYYESYCFDLAGIQLHSIYEIYRATVRIKIDEIQANAVTSDSSGNHADAEQAEDASEKNKNESQETAFNENYFRSRIKRYIEIINLLIENENNKQINTNRLHLLPAEKVPELDRNELFSVESDLFDRVKYFDAIVFAGLPATGKTTVAYKLSQITGKSVFSSDVLRKRLMHYSPESSAESNPYSGIYSNDISKRVYRKLSALFYYKLLANQGVILDAGYHNRKDRDRLRELAERINKKVVIVWLDIDTEIIEKRLFQRRNEASRYSDVIDFETWSEIKKNCDLPEEDESNLCIYRPTI